MLAFAGQCAAAVILKLLHNSAFERCHANSLNLQGPRTAVMGRQLDLLKLGPPFELVAASNEGADFAIRDASLQHP